MAELHSYSRSALDGVAPGRHGVPTGPAGVTVAVLDHLTLASVMARRNQEAALRERIQALFGFMPGSVRRRFGSGNVDALGVAPGRWLFLGEGGEAGLAARLATELTGLASVTDQSDGHIVFEIGGPSARRALAKGVPIDLHPSAFGTDDAAVTLVSHIGTTIWQPEAGRYRMALYRSYAKSFWHWLEASAAEFGLDVMEPTRR